jgi:hypothetical protein
LAPGEPRVARWHVTAESEWTWKGRQQRRGPRPQHDQRVVGPQRNADGPQVRVSAKQIREQGHDREQRRPH